MHDHTSLRTLRTSFWFYGVTALLIASAASHESLAQEAYPSRTIKLVVPFAAGGNGDAIGRLTASFMQKTLGESVVVENRPGAGGLIGTDLVTKSAADGYTLCVCSTGPITVAPWTERMTYNPLTDLIPISLINTNALVLIVNPKLDFKKAADVVAMSKTQPNGLSYSSVGAAGLVTYSAEIFRVQTGAKLVGVPYRGGALATSAVVSGEVQLSFANASDAIGQLQGNTVRALAVTTAKRSEFLPDVPTLIEEKLVQYPVESWNALFAPAGTPKPVVDKLAATMEQMAKDPEVRKAMANFGSTATSTTPQQFGQILKEETAQWEESLAAIKMKKN
jgi:tripartite-type tricarboxylate transporter receptor subunit TctC